MANPKHVEILKQGVEMWNTWVKDNERIEEQAGLFQRIHIKADLVAAHLPGVTLREVDLMNSDLVFVNFTGADLRYGKFAGASLVGAHLMGADFRHADLRGAVLVKADLRDSDLRGADLRGANLTGSNFENAKLTGCRIFGIAAWNVNLDHVEQKNLITTDLGEPEITVDNLKVAQFIYLLLNNEEIRDVINTITSKVVLILGCFKLERKQILDKLRSEIRKYNYSPVVFDFEKPGSRDFTETVRVLAHISKFIIADLTDPSSIPQELQAVVPDLAIIRADDILSRS